MPDAPAFLHCFHAVQYLNSQHGWGLAPGDMRYYADNLSQRWPELAQAPELLLERAICNFHLDHDIVESLQQEASFEHAGAWRTWFEQATFAMLARGRVHFQIDADAADVEDIVQTAMLDIWKGLAAFQYRSRFGHWAAVTIANCFNRHLRKLGAERRIQFAQVHSLEGWLESGADVADTSAPTVEAQAFSALLVGMLRNELARRSDWRLLAVFDLCILGNRTTRATGDVLKLSPSRIHALIQQVRGIIHEYLAKEIWFQNEIASDV